MENVRVIPKPSVSFYNNQISGGGAINFHVYWFARGHISRCFQLVALTWQLKRARFFDGKSVTLK